MCAEAPETGQLGESSANSVESLPLPALLHLDSFNRVASRQTGRVASPRRPLEFGHYFGGNGDL